MTAAPPAPRPPAELSPQVLIKELVWRNWTVWEVAPRSASYRREVVYLHGDTSFAELTAEQWHFLAELCEAASVRCLVPVRRSSTAVRLEAVVADLRRFVSDMIAAQGESRVAVLGDHAGHEIALAVTERLGEAEGDAEPPHPLVLSAPTRKRRRIRRRRAARGLRAIAVRLLPEHGDGGAHTVSP